MKSDRQIERPDIIVPDSGPLIHLAHAEALHLLHQVGRRVVVTDMVAYEATADRSKPRAQDIKDWLDAGQAPGSNAPVSVETTDVGRAFFTALKADPDFKWKGAGEQSIVNWLNERVDATDTAMIVVYENGKVPRMIGGVDIDVDIDVLTTRAFLELAERNEIVPSADAYWRRIADAASTANPRVAVTSFRRPAEGGEPQESDRPRGRGR